jgi:hypothetical protein
VESVLATIEKDQMIDSGFHPQFQLLFTSDPRVNVQRTVRRVQKKPPTGAD